MIQWHTGAKRVETLAFSPDGRTLASATYQGEVVKLWRSDGTAVGKLSVGFPVHAAAFGPDGQWLAVGHGAGLTLYDPADRTNTLALEADGYGRCLAWRPDGSALAAVVGQRLLWWDAPIVDDDADAPGPLHRELDVDWLARSGASSLAFTPDGRRLVLNSDTAAVVWDESAGKVVRWLPHAAHFIQTLVGVSPDGRRVAASHGRDISVWALDADDPPVLLPGSTKSRSVRGMVFTPDGSLLAAGSDGLARRWDAATGAEREAWDFGLKNVQSLAVAPDGLTAAAGSHDGRIVVWDL